MNDRLPLRAVPPADVTVTVQPETNSPPVVDPGADQAVTVPHDGNPATNTAAFTFAGQASDPDGDTATIEVAAAATAMRRRVRPRMSPPGQ